MQKIQISKKQIYIILLIIIVLFILFFIFFLFINKKNENKIKIQIPKRQNSIKTNVVLIKDCEEIKNIQKKEKCLNEAKRNKAAISHNIKECLEINDYNFRNKCIYRYVRTDNTIESCRRIANHRLQEICIGDIGIEHRDVNFCESFLQEPHEYQECIDRITAFKFGDSGDINKCNEIKTLEYSSLCLQNSLKSGKSCNDIRDKALKDKCISMIFNNYASTKNECEKIPDSNYKKVCLIRLNNPDDMRIDTDGDGLINKKELWFNTDPFNPDTDGDGLSDYEEMIDIHSNPVDSDTDGDGLSDYDEIKLGTNIQRPDTDGDGILDGADDDPLNKFNDTDSDRLSNEDEKKWGTYLNKKDTDGDGVNDWEEIRNGTNALGEGWQHDTDGDGLIDVDEIFYRTNRLEPDTDGDGINDGDEVRNLTNPLGKGDMDFDKDGLSDKDEEKYKTNPSKKDTNDDGVDDLEAIQKGLEAVNNDTDGDGLNNRYELNKLMTSPLKADTDGDGLKDLEEISQYFTDPNNQDTDNDGYLDGDEVKKGYNPNGKGKL